MGKSTSARERRVDYSLDLARDLLRACDTKVARQAIRLSHEHHDQLLSLAIDVHGYDCPDLFGRDWLAVNLLSKLSTLDTGIDTAAVAIAKFNESEALCGIVNNRLRSFVGDATTSITGVSLLETARYKIQRLLGEFDWDRITPFLRFSGGASTRLKRSKGDAYHKFGGIPDVTREAALLGCCAIETTPLWRDSIREAVGIDYTKWVNVVAGSRITTVPKNAKTDRVIAIEPELNMFLQLGCGGLLRSRLKTVGIDLNDQSRNQDLARIGSIDNSLSTIDLRAASDSISIELVRWLLPPSWFSALDMIRSKVGVLPDGSHVEYQKFSSMGNGFTFELESMIFWALAEAVVDQVDGARLVAVYGDDIIVPTAAAGFLVELLSFVGFETNTDKSFFSGPFRESCGKHWFRGVDVTPLYVRDPIDSLSRLYWFANSVRRYAARAVPGYADPRFKKAWDRCVQKIPPKRRIFVPEGVGDGGLIGTFAEACPRRERNRGRNFHWGWSYDRLMEGSGREIDVFDRLALLRALMHGGCGTSLTKLLVGREKKWYRWVTEHTSQWTDAPLWCVA